MRSFSIILTTFLLSTIGFSQEKTTKNSFDYKTSAECNTCKKLIESTLNYTKGIKYAELDIESKTLHVSFNEKKISENEIKTIVSELGYDIDNVKANPKSVENLPACCKPGGMNN